MAVTELALLHLLPPTTIKTQSLLEHLRSAKLAMEKASGFKFYLLQCVEDPNLIFIVGSWPSVEFHMQEWIPSEENQRLLKMMEGEMEVEYMFHVELEPGRREAVMKSEVVGVGRHVVEKRGKDDFKGIKDVNRENLEGYVGGEGKVVGGCRADRGYVKGDPEGVDGEEKGEESDEWVLFTGWESVKKDSEYAMTGEMTEYSKIPGFVHGGDIKHGVMVQLG